MNVQVALYTNSISPHQVPLASQLVAAIGVDRFRYIYTTPLTRERRKIGWSEAKHDWVLLETDSYREARDILERSTLLIAGIRDIALFEKRARNGKRTIYSSERWFKPSLGMLRLLNPKYFSMARRFANLVRNYSNVWYYPMGIHAACDMARLCGLLSGDIKCLFRPPNLDFERKPGGRIWLKCGGDGNRYCLDKMRMWGYFVEPSKFTGGNSKMEKADGYSTLQAPKIKTLRVLWVGRLLNWKRVETIVRAVSEHAGLRRIDGSLPEITLDIYGTGPEESRLKKLASKYSDVIKFSPPVPIHEVRRLMREHDVYVLSSNAYEGWGAVVNEALSEGSAVVGTYEAGSSATILPAENLFHAGDWRGLLKVLHSYTIPSKSFAEWSLTRATKIISDLL